MWLDVSLIPLSLLLVARQDLVRVLGPVGNLEIGEVRLTIFLGVRLSAYIL